MHSDFGLSLCTETSDGHILDSCQCARMRELLALREFFLEGKVGVLQKKSTLVSVLDRVERN